MHLPPWHKIKQQYMDMVLPGQEDAAKQAEDCFSKALSELEVSTWRWLGGPLLQSCCCWSTRCWARAARRAWCRVDTHGLAAPTRQRVSAPAPAPAPPCCSAGAQAAAGGAEAEGGHALFCGDGQQVHRMLLYSQAFARCAPLLRLLYLPQRTFGSLRGELHTPFHPATPA
jgi:hypothetical protein